MNKNNWADNILTFNPYEKRRDFLPRLFYSFLNKKVSLFFLFAGLLFWIANPLICRTNEINEPNKRMLDDPMEFTGWEGKWGDPKRLKDIRLGLFAPNRSDDPVGCAMIQGASLAVMQANEKGGFQGVPFRLMTRWADDPWGAGSKEMIRLIYEDHVWAVIGSLNGDATHIAQQIVTKARLPLFSPVSSDTTLTFIRIPWIFRLPSSDRQQVRLLVEEGILSAKLEKIGVLTSTTHDGRMLAFEIEEALLEKQLVPLFHFKVSEKVDFQDIIDRINSFKPDGLFLHLPREQIQLFLNVLKKQTIQYPLFIPWIPGLKVESLRQEYEESLYAILPYDSEKDTDAYRCFVDDYGKAYGTSPNACAAYTYDAVNMFIEAVRTAGLNRVHIRDAIAKMNGYAGVTGIIEWDNGGGNLGKPYLYFNTSSNPRHRHPDRQD